MKKKFIAGWLVLWGFFRSWGECGMAPPNPFETEEAAPNNPFQSEDRLGKVVLSSCDGIPSGLVDVGSHIKVTGAITCASTKFLKVSSGNTVLVYGDDDVTFYGVHFLVEPGGQLNFLADGDIFLERKETMKHLPIVSFDGDVIFVAGEYIEGQTEVSETPREGETQTVLWQMGSTRAITTPGLVLTENAVIVTSKVGDSSKVDRQQAKESGKLDAAQDLATIRLKVGQVLQREEALTSTDGAYKIWAGRHGSVFFSSNVDSLHEDGPGALIPANKARVKGVLQVRAKLDEKKASGGGEAKTSWTPWGRRYNRRLQRARDHAGEVHLTVDNRACLEVTVDGCCVLAKSGPYSREWVNKCRYFRRVRSSDYELVVVADGLEVQRAGRKVWGVSISKRSDDTDER